MTAVDANAAEAARILHEDQVSANVGRVRDQLSKSLWVLYHARDYSLGVLQLLERLHLLRDLEEEKAAEQRSQEMLRAFGPQATPREKAYKRLAQLAAKCLPPSYGDEVRRIADVHTEAGIEATNLTNLTVASWAHGGSSEDALALARVRRLADESWRRKTITRQALLDALHGEAVGVADAT